MLCFQRYASRGICWWRNDRLRPQDVILGSRFGEFYLVQEGLQAQDKIVSSGVFLLASESRLRSATHLESRVNHIIRRLIACANRPWMVLAVFLVVLLFDRYSAPSRCTSRSFRSAGHRFEFLVGSKSRSHEDQLTIPSHRPALRTQCILHPKPIFGRSLWPSSMKIPTSTGLFSLRETKHPKTTTRSPHPTGSRCYGFRLDSQLCSGRRRRKNGSCRSSRDTGVSTPICSWKCTRSRRSR